MSVTIQLRRDLAASWTSNNPILAQGEVGVEYDTGNLKVGNGTSTWTELSYSGLLASDAITWTAPQTFDAPITQTPGQGANNSTPFAQYGDLFSDAIMSGLTTTTSSTLSGALESGDAYVIGQRVVYPGGNYTVAASSTSYLDLSNTGQLTVATSSTVTANSLRLWMVTSSATAITGVTQVAPSHPSASLGPETYLYPDAYHHFGVSPDSGGFFGLYSGDSPTIGMSIDMPLPAGCVGFGNYYSGMGLQAITSGQDLPVFGVFYPGSAAFGINGAFFSIYDNNIIETFNTTLDDGNGNTTIAKKLLQAASVGSTTTLGALTITAAQLIAGYFTDSATQTAVFTVTTDTAPNLLSALPAAAVGSSFKFRFFNNDQSTTGYAATLAAGAGVTISANMPNPAIAKGAWADYLFTFTDVTSGSAAVTATYIGQGTI